MLTIIARARRVALIAALAPAAACGEFLEVTNPGPIEDEALNDPDAVPGLVVGMSGDLSLVLDDIIMLNSVAGDDLAHGGSYTQPGLFFRGIIEPEDVNYEWAASHRARWVAEQGVERIKSVLGDNYDASVHAARANMFAGFANRNLGENMCDAVIDKGPREDHAVHFSRAEAYFTEAIRIATAADNDEVLNASLAGRASVRAWQGNWAGAVADAAQVPTDFVFAAKYSDNSSRENNDLRGETHFRREYTVYSTPWANVFDDPRVPWDTIFDKSGAVAKGQDGKTPFFRQEKFTEIGSDIPLAKGTEMRILEAEAALRAGGLAGIPRMVTLLDEARAFYGMGGVAVPTTLEAAWDLLQFERAATLWLEGRRFWDLRRFFEETGPAHIDFLEGRDSCIPISREELQSNPNLG